MRIFVPILSLSHPSFPGLMIRSVFPLLFGLFLLPSGLQGTPPDITGTREVLLGANDSVMALYIQTWENEGSHYFRRETLSFSIQSIESGEVREHVVLSVVEYLPDEDFEKKIRKVVEASEFDLVTELNRYGMALPFFTGWPDGFTVSNQGVWLGLPDRGEVQVTDSVRLASLFDGQPVDYSSEEGDPGLYTLGGVYSVFPSGWIFLEVSLSDYHSIDPVTRILPINSTTLSERIDALREE